ncbi:hypothetical protein LA080_006842 [Diaporthe eres]|nr:hypothetical protein LA080_006842 [Diaporthe eres]
MRATAAAALRGIGAGMATQETARRRSPAFALLTRHVSATVGMLATTGSFPPRSLFTGVANREHPPVIPQVIPHELPGIASCCGQAAFDRVFHGPSIQPIYSPLRGDHRVDDLYTYAALSLFCLI